MATTPGKTPVDIVGPGAFAAEIQLADGTVLEIALQISGIERIEGAVNPDGSQRYDFKAGVTARTMPAAKAVANG